MGSPAAKVAGDGFDYLRHMVESVFTDAEHSYEAIAASDLAAGTDVVLGEVAAGVTADVLSLEVVGFSAALLLSEYAFGWLLTKFAELFPNPSIFGWHPLAFIQEGLTSFGHQFESSAVGLGEPIATFFTQPVRQLLGLFQRGGNATASAHNKIAQVVTVHVPQARHDAVLTANAYTDQQIATLQTTLTNSITALSTSIHDQIATTTRNLNDNIASAIKTLDTNLVKALQGDEATLAALANTVTVTLPLEVQTMVNDAVATENLKLVAQGNALQSKIDAIQTQVIALANKVASDEATLATAQATLTTLQSQSTLDSAAISAQKALITQTQLDITTATTAVADLNTKITGISSQLAPIHAAQQLNTMQLSPFEAIGAIALPTVLATLASTLTNLKTKVDTCTIDTCNPQSPNNIKNVLKNLLMMMSAAGELAFIEQAVREPEASANELAPGLDAIASGALDALHALLSL